MHNVRIQARSRNHCCSEKYISVCVRAPVLSCACLRVLLCGFPGAQTCAYACARVALLIRHATRRRHIILSFVGPLYPKNFFDSIS
jgi:hypothetical protein